MRIPEKARAKARALMSAVPRSAVAVTVTGLALGGAYLAGEAVMHVAEARSLRQAAALDDQSAQAIAARHGASLVADASGGRAERMAASLERGTRKLYNPASAPYVGGVIDQARELQCLSEAVYYEARGETPAGQAAVAQVVLNRVRHPAFPKSVCAVVYQGVQSGRGCQFSFACNGATNRRRETGAWTRAQRVAERAFNGYVMPDVGTATHFHVTSVSPGWGASLMRVAQIGTHIFYRFGGRSGAPSALASAPAPEMVSPEAAPAPEAVDGQQPQLIMASAVTSEPAPAAEAVVVIPSAVPATPQAAVKPAAPAAEAAKPAADAVKPAPEPAKPAEPSKPSA